MSQTPFKITIEKPYYGWIPSLWTSTGHALESSFNLMGQYSGYQEYSYSSSMMPNRPGFEGHLAPPPAFVPVVDAGGIVNGLALNSVITPDGTCYVLLDSNRYVTMSSLSTPAVSQTIFGTVGSAVLYHGTHVSFATFNGDVANFATSGTNNSYAYISWTDNIDGDIGQFVGSTGTANYYTGIGGTALQTGKPHPLLVGNDRFIYFGNGNVLGKFNPVTNTPTDIALTLPPYWTIQGACEYQNYHAIAAWQQNASPEIPQDKGQAMLFFWDGIATAWNFQYDMQDFFVSNIFYDGQNLYVITYGRNGTTKLKQFNGQGFDTLWESATIGLPPGNPNYGRTPVIGGVDLWLNHIVWTNGDQLASSLNTTGFINSYGSPEAQDFPAGFHQFAQFPPSGISSLTRIGMVKNLYQNTLFMGNCDVNGTYSIQYSDFTKYAVNGEFISPLISLPANSTIDNVKVWLSQWGAGAALNLGIFKDYSTLGFGGTNDFLQWNPTATALGTSVTYMYQTQSIANVNSFYLGIEWSHALTSNTAAIIRKIEINGFSDDDNI
jgi:hypothetical protein